MLALAKRAASLAELIAAGSLIVGLLQNEITALWIGFIFTVISFGVTWFVDRIDGRDK